MWTKVEESLPGQTDFFGTTMDAIGRPVRSAFRRRILPRKNKHCVRVGQGLNRMVCTDGTEKVVWTNLKIIQRSNKDRGRYLPVELSI